MQITALGHSCVLLDFEDHETGEHTRILVDPWLSDHATGDAMGRFPRLRFETSALGPIDAVFISHAHCDHLDPYTLTRLWRELESPPILLLPVTLAYLIPVFTEYLEDCQIGVLEAQVPAGIGGVDLLGFYDIGEAPTNEDDVMVLAIRNGPEAVLIEADANLSLEDPPFREFISRILTEPGVESAVFLTTENELTGTMSAKDQPHPDARAALAEFAMHEMVEAVERLYTRSEDPSDLWNAPHLIRLVHGQGLAAAPELDPRWQHILFPVRIADRVQCERAVAEQLGLRHQVDSLTVGSVHTVEHGRLTRIDPVPGLRQLDNEHDRTYDPHSDFFPSLPLAPVRTDTRDIEAQHARLLDLLNHRFLPYLHGLRQPPVLHLLGAYGGEYRVRVHFGASLDEPALDYILDFVSPRFMPAEPDGTPPQETYWANDLDDFLDGRCDAFSTSCRSQFPGEEPRLWACLATPLLSADLCERRVRLHFELARSGACPGSFVVHMLHGSTDPHEAPEI